MAESSGSSRSVYLQSLKRIPSLAFSAFCCALLLKLVAIAITAGTGKGSGFDAAVGLLFHYPESFKAILALLAAVCFLWAVPLLFYPSDIGNLLWKWVVVPSLHIVEHMLSLALGVLVAWLVADFISGDEGLTLKVLGSVVLMFALLGMFAVLCSVMAVFTSQELEEIAPTIPKAIRIPLFVVLGGVLIGAVFLDFVWKYQPIVTAGH